MVSDNANLPSPAQYQFGTYSMMTKQALNNWAASTLDRLRIQPGLTGAVGPVWAVPVSPGYDDRSRNRQQTVYIDRAGGQRYEDEWAAALNTLPDWVVITSWNEYMEQTHIAPGTTTGSQALDQTARWAAQFHRTG